MAKLAEMAAPMHLGFKGKWTEQMQTDWTEFRTKQQREAVDLMLSFLCSKICMVLLIWRVFLDSTALGFSWRRLLFGSMSTCMAVFSVFAFLLGPYVRRTVYKLDVRFASMLQMSLLLVLQTVNLLTACSMETELMQHRYYLTSQIVMLGIMWGGAYVPLWAHFFLGVPMNLTSWLLFHRLVGFWQVHGFFKVAAFGALACVLVPLPFVAKERVLWWEFQSHRQLDREREVLEATQAALRCMLSSLWDASCVSDEHGIISSSTPHLAQLFGGGADLVGSCLADFAANDADSERIQDFLKNTASAASEQAYTLQFTAQPRWSTLDSQEAVRRLVHYEVALYGIKLPPGALSDSSCRRRDGKNLFIGIKASTADTGGVDAAFTTLREACGNPKMHNLPKHLLDCLTQSATAAESTAEPADTASLLHGTTSVFSFDYAASQSISTKETFRNGLSSSPAANIAQHEVSTQTELSDAETAELAQPPEGGAAGPGAAPVRLSLDALCPADESPISVSTAVRDSRSIKLEFEEVTRLRSSAPLFRPLTSSSDANPFSKKGCSDTKTTSAPPQDDSDCNDDLAGSQESDASDESLPLFGPVTLTLDSLCPSKTDASSSQVPALSGSSTEPHIFNESYVPDETHSVPAAEEAPEALSSAKASWPGSPPKDSEQHLSGCTEDDSTGGESDIVFGSVKLALSSLCPGQGDEVCAEELCAKDNLETCVDDAVGTDLADEIEQHAFGSDTSSADSLCPEDETMRFPEPLQSVSGPTTAAHEQHWTSTACSLTPSNLHEMAVVGPAQSSKATSCKSEQAAPQLGPVRLSLDILCAPIASGPSPKEQESVPIYDDVLQAAWQSVQRPASSNSSESAEEHGMAPDSEMLHLVSCLEESSAVARGIEESDEQEQNFLSVQFVDAEHLRSSAPRPGVPAQSASQSVSSISSSDEAVSVRANILLSAKAKKVAYVPGRLLRHEASKHEADSSNETPKQRRSRRIASRGKQQPWNGSRSSSGSPMDSSCSSSHSSDDWVPLRKCR